MLPGCAHCCQESSREEAALSQVENRDSETGMIFGLGFEREVGVHHLETKRENIAARG